MPSGTTLPRELWRGPVVMDYIRGMGPGLEWPLRSRALSLGQSPTCGSHRKTAETQRRKPLRQRLRIALELGGVLRGEHITALLP